MSNVPMPTSRFLVTASVFAVIHSFCGAEDAAGMSTSQSCMEEVFAVNQEMQNKYKLNVTQPSMQHIGDKANPFKGSKSITFAMVTHFNSHVRHEKVATSNAVNFMNSEGVQTRLARRVMNNCQDISKVLFGFARSGEAVPYFRMPSGQIRKGIDLDCSRDNNVLQWGYYSSC